MRTQNPSLQAKRLLCQSPDIPGKDFLRRSPIYCVWGSEELRILLTCIDNTKRPEKEHTFVFVWVSSGGGVIAMVASTVGYCQEIVEVTQIYSAAS